MNPCCRCEIDPDICPHHPCNGCDADDDECFKCQITEEGFDCNCFKENKQYGEKL